MEPGAVLDGRYELLSVLDKDAIGTVWQGSDRRTGRPVAVKTVTGATDQWRADRMGREATAAGGLSHPHIVTVHDYGQTTYHEQPVTYIVMELVDGRPLTAELADGRPDLSVALGWARQITLALGAAHAPGVGVVHRDLRPGNVLVTDDGLVKITGFGAARFTEPPSGGRTPADPRPAHPATPSGTAAYLAPEQCLYRPVDGRTDLYALGCLLYEMVTGAPPFTKGSAGTVAHSQVHETPATPRSRNSAISPELDLLIRELLAKNPEMRPPDAASVYRRLGVVAAVRAEEVVEEQRRRELPRPPAAMPRQPVKDIPYAELLHRFGGAYALSLEDDPATAVLLWKRAVAELTATVGADDPKTLVARRALAWHTGACGAYADAVAMWQELLPDVRRVMGGTHESAYTAQRMLGWAVGVDGRPEEAVKTLAGMLPGVTRLLGRRHPDVLEARRFLAWNTGVMGRHARAVRLLRRLLPDLRDTLGADHEHTLEARGILAWNTGRGGDLVKATALLRGLVPDSTRALGAGHPLTVDILVVLDNWTQ